MPTPKYKPGDKVWVVVWDNDNKKMSFAEQTIEFHAQSWNKVTDFDPKKKKTKSEEYRKLIYHTKETPVIPYKECELFETEVDAREYILKQLT